MSLHRAAANGNLEIVNELMLQSNIDAQGALILNGAKVNEKDNYGSTPLHHAASNGNLEVVEKLILNGAKVNEKDNVGRTPLHWEHIMIILRW